MKRNSKGMALVEVVFAATLLSMSLAVLVPMIDNSRRIRVNADARREVATLLHSRCLQFSTGSLYPNAETMRAGAKAVVDVPVENLEGGIASILTHQEVVEVSPGGNFAQLHITVTFESTKSQPLTSEAYSIRYF